MPRTVVTCLAGVLLAVFALAAPASSRAETISIAPTADAFIRQSAPQTNFGSQDYLDSLGGADSYVCGSDNDIVFGKAFSYLKFDLSQIPAGANLQSVSLQLTSRAGFAWDGDPFQHLRFVGDDSWTEGGITYDHTPEGTDQSYDATTDIFYDFPVCGDPKGEPRVNTFSDEALTNRVESEREGDDTLSLQVFNNGCTDCPTGGNQGYWVRFYSREAADPALRPRLVVTYEGQKPPTLYSAVSDPETGGTTLVGRITGAPSTSYGVTVFTSQSCEDGELTGERNYLTSLEDVTTDESGTGYFAETVDDRVPAGSYVAAQVQDPQNETSSPLSRCVLAPDNDTWTRAQQLRPVQSEDSTAQETTVSQSLDYDGQARWYRFDVAPDSQVTLDLDGLAANYDLFVFKDIGAALSPVSSDEDLLKLSAELGTANSAPSAFSPSAFSPSAFSPSAFSPSAFSPSAFSPSAFSPSAFSPSAFSPSAFSPSAFSPSAFSPSAFSPSAFSPDAYSSAQVRSLIGGSTNEGTAAERITLNSWGNTPLYVRVNGRLGASSAGDDFRLKVTSDAGSCTGVTPIGSAPADAPGQSLKTVVLSDLSRMGGTPAEKAAMLAKLQTLVARPDVAGTIVDLSQSERIEALNAQGDAHAACPFAKNLVASAIKDVVDSYRANNPDLKYVVAVGNDRAVPFFRYPDTAGLGPESEYVPPVVDASASQASLRRNYVLSQDAYGSKTEISLGMGSLPLPDLAVGRLAEQPASISTVLDAYLGTANGVAPTPKSSLVTGYDFLTDAAQAVQKDFSAGLGSGAGVRKDELITNADVPPTDVGTPPAHSWTADQLRSSLLGSRHDLIYLAGHFSANNALAADYTSTMDATELAASNVDLTNTLVAGAGCHSGYNIVDEDAVPGVTVPLDWVEAFAQKGATMVAGTGYQYGDTDFLEYSERLYSDFTTQLRIGTGAVPVGEALVKAKQTYLAQTPSMRGIHTKALLEATLYGLPMLSYDLPSGRLPVPTSTSVVEATVPFRTPGPGTALGLTYADVGLTPSFGRSTKDLANTEGGGTTTATWWTGPDGVLTNPGEPAIPLARYDVGVPGRVARGVGFRGGTFIAPEPTGLTPLTGGATTEKQAVHTPFAPSVWYPLRMWSLNYFGALAGAGGSTTLNVTPAQYKADAPGSNTAAIRRYTDLDLRVYYSDEQASYPTSPGSPPNTPALAAPPAIADVTDSVDGDDVKFRVKAVGDPSAGIQEVWITYSGVHAGKWEPLDLRQNREDSTLWTGTLTLPPDVDPGAVRYIVQAVNGVGVTSLDDNFGAYYAPPARNASIPATPQGTTLTLTSPPASGVYRTSASVTAELRDEHGVAVAGEPIAFGIGSATRTATTDASGRATASVPLTDQPGDYRLTAGFGGDAAYTGSSDALARFTVTRLPATLTLSPASLTAVDPGPTATLSADGAPLIAQTVLFVLKRDDGSQVAAFSRITDVQGRARIGAADVPSGNYSLTAYFGGTVLLAAGPITLGDPTPYTTATAVGSVHVCLSGCTETGGTVSGTVPATLALALGAPASFGAFAPGVSRGYTASTTALVTSSAGDAALTVSDPSTVAPGRLVNGSFALAQPLQVGVAGALAPVGGVLKTWAGPISNDPFTIDFKQSIGERDALRTGTYSKTLTFTLSTTMP